MNKSIWENYLNKKNYPKVESNLETDVLVIGAGITGIMIARKLHDHNIKTVLVDKNTIASGNTLFTTAHLTVQHETLYQDLSYKKRLKYLSLNKKSLNELIELSKIIDFDFEYADSTLFSSNEKIIHKEYEVLKALGEDVYLNENIPLFINSTGISFKNQGMINPIKLTNHLVDGLDIYEHSEIVKIKKNYAILKNNKIIKFKKVIIATHYPIINKSNFLFMKLIKHKSFVVVIKYKKFKGTYCSIDQGGMYFRNYQDYLIIGGNDRKTGCKCETEFREKICKLFNLKSDDILYSYSATDCITLDGIPYIGYSNLFNKRIIIATGFNFWGFTWANAASNIILKIITEKKVNKLTKPNRLILNLNLLKNIYTSIINLISFKKPRCSHLGCNLIYNKEEKIYECPCHGSIYSSDGKVLQGPASKDVKTP